ncbi:hypothetical protein LIA77_00214 [Sarocladium implicatum]|nr:hypothetical protein LIA77_00214 [Sarocladium implicatum]
MAGASQQAWRRNEAQTRDPAVTARAQPDASAGTSTGTYRAEFFQHDMPVSLGSPVKPDANVTIFEPTSAPDKVLGRVLSNYLGVIGQFTGGNRMLGDGVVGAIWGGELRRGSTMMDGVWAWPQVRNALCVSTAHFEAIAEFCRSCLFTRPNRDHGR